MRIVTFSFFVFSLVGFQLFSQNSDFTSANPSQCPGNLFTVSADDPGLSSYQWTITDESGTPSVYNVNPIAFVLTNPGLLSLIHI